MNSTRLRALRQRLGMTQAELAEALGYADGAVIRHKELGYRKVTKRDILACEALLAKRKTQGD